MDRTSGLAQLYRSAVDKYYLPWACTAPRKTPPTLKWNEAPDARPWSWQQSVGPVEAKRPAYYCDNVCAIMLR